MFSNREEAGRRLADKLREKYFADPVVLALLMGGLPVAKEVSKALDTPLDVLLVRKIGVPGRSEVAAGAICEGESPIFNHELLRGLELTPEMLEPFVEEKRKEIALLRNQFRNGKDPLDFRGKDVIIVDDGIASGVSALMAIKGARQRGAESVTMAAPFVAKDAISRIADVKVEVVALEIVEHVLAVPRYYQEPLQTYTESAHPE